MRMTTRPVLLLVAYCALAALSACVDVVPRQEQTVDGLVRVPETRADKVYAIPNLSLAKYNRLLLDPVKVSFVSGWQTQAGVTAADVTRIRERAATVFREVFAKELTERGGYRLVDQAGADVLYVHAEIMNLRITAPPTPPASGERTFLVSASDMTLMAELRDSVSGALLVRAADMSKGRELGDLRVVNQDTNTDEGRKAFAMWASLLREALDSAKSAPPAAK